MWGPRLSGRAKLDSLFDLELSDCRLLNPSPCGLRLFQDGDLPGVVKLVLRHSVQQMVEIVFFAGDALAKAGLRQRGNRLHQHIVRALRLSERFAPRSLGGFGNNREIRSARKLDRLAANAAESSTVPSSDVQHKFPDAVNFKNRLGRGRGSVHVLQQLKQSRTMPGIAFKGAAQLIGDKLGFGHGGSHILTFSSAENIPYQALRVRRIRHHRDSCGIRRIDSILPIHQQALPGI